MNSQFKNLMSVEQFAHIGLLDPWMVAGWCIADDYQGCKCGINTYPERMFQNRYLSRAEISRAIWEAEQMIYEFLGYYTAPVSVVGEKHKYPMADGRRSYKYPANLARPTMITRDGKDYKSIELERGFIQSIGTITEQDLGEQAVVLNAAKTLFTVSFNLGSEPVGDETYKVYFTESERYDGETKEQWEIRDVRSSVSNGTTVTITGNAYLLLKPSLRQGRRWECVQDDLANFSTTVHVFSERVDTTNHGSLQWGKRPCLSSETDCNETTIMGLCLERDDTELYPLVRPTPKAYNNETQTWEKYNYNSAPDWVLVNYVAGVPRVNGLVDIRYARPTFYLAASLLNREAPTCGCQGIENDELEKYRQVQKAKVKEVDAENINLPIESERILAQKKHLDSPWGALYGAVLAWNMIYSIKNRDR